MALEWIASRSMTVRDLDWHPIPLVFGYLRTANGVRWAVLLGNRLGVTTEGGDVEFSTHVAELVETGEGDRPS